MTSSSLLFVALTIPSLQPAQARWEYPADGGTSYDEISTSKSGKIRCYATVVKASPETVVLWYAKQLGLDRDHGVVQQANAGYRQLKNRHIGGYVIDHNTDDRQLAAVIETAYSAESAHVHILVRPDHDSKQDISISIVQVPSGTSISVIQSVSDSG